MFEAAKKKINLVAKARKTVEAIFKAESFEQGLAMMEEMGLNVSYAEIPVERQLAIEELGVIADAAIQPGAKLFKAQIQKQGYPDLVLFGVLKGS